VKTLEANKEFAIENATEGPLPSGRRCSILGMRVDELNYDCVINRIRQWARTAESRYMCISTVHMVMEAYDDPDFGRIVNNADLVGADGIPVIRVSRWLGLRQQDRVFAPELVIKLCKRASEEKIAVGFYGSTPEVIRDIVHQVTLQFPALTVAYSCSPPFRVLTHEEMANIALDINDSGTRILFVGLGCPRQERWMSEMRTHVNAVMLGVGWAFDVVARHSNVAPAWIQRIGMEWFFRLVLNPRKLWRRHLRNNPRFILLVLLQFFRLRFLSSRPV
jgi:N-acetylglucosaminyldiphosphoundecaprenol N-acetyl-beta-D-mannosaminyltransferase